MDFLQNEINQILLAKKLNEFYFAIIEKKESVLTDEKYAELRKKKMSVYLDDKYEMKEILIKLNKDDNIQKIKEALFSLAQKRYLAILTLIDGKVYDICSTKFVDLNECRIIHFDNLTNYYDERNARIKLFAPEEEPRLEQECALLDVDEDTFVQLYESMHLNQRENRDLTDTFFTEAKDKARKRIKM